MSTSTNMKGVRHGEWFLGLVFCTISLIAMASLYDGGISEQDRTTKWILSGIIVTLVLSATAFFGSMLLGEKFYSTPIEGIVALLFFGFWCAVLPGIMSPLSGFAQSSNLYFSSWGGFIMSFVIVLNYADEKYGTSKNISKLTETQTTWGCLCMTSFVVMVSASRLFIAFMCKDRDNKRCSRTAWGISLGVISAFVSILWLGLSPYISEKSTVEVGEAIASVLLFIFWTFGVGYLTFGSNAPAPTMGNLYFFTWGSFVLSAYLAINVTKKLMNKDEGEQTSDNQKNQEEGVSP